MKTQRIRILFCLGFGFAAVTAQAADWLQYRGNAERSGYTSDPLTVPLTPRWEYKSRHVPQPAWPVSNIWHADDRLPFDRVYHLAVAGGKVYFGSSADGKVTALDAATGKECWAFFSGAPVRFAPAVWRDRVFAVSDDGYLHCLAAKDGKEMWKVRGGPSDEMLLGNERMISRWPARGGPVIKDNVTYFGAGIWPMEGTALHAVDALTGRIVWVNDKCSGMVVTQPHGFPAKSGVPMQGHLVATADKLYVPTGRATPAVFKRSDGSFLSYSPSQWGGGSSVSLIGRYLFTGGALLNVRDMEKPEKLDRKAARQLQGKIRDKFKGFSADTVAAWPGGLVHSSETSTTVYAWKKEGDAGEKRRDCFPEWSVEVKGGKSLIVAGQTIVVGATGTVSVVDMRTRKVAWTHEVEGTPYGLAVSDNRLFASTDTGKIYCFVSRVGKDAAPLLVEAARENRPYGDNEFFARAAQEIIEKTGITEGYCLDLGCRDGALAYELAKRTKLRIYGIDSDQGLVAAARAKLDASGLYGVRVTIHKGDLAKTPYPPYFANLIVSSRSLKGESEAFPASEAIRMQRPCGGVVCLGKGGAIKVTTRGPLEGAGEWTHQYADASNTGCSSDTLVRGRLSMLWFKGSDLKMPNRHGRSHAPLYSKGVLFVEGRHALRAVDAYNGRTMWELPFEDILTMYNRKRKHGTGSSSLGTSATGSNICAVDGSIYLCKDSSCLQIDAKSGKITKTFLLPNASDGQPGIWGYVAVAEGALYGSLVNKSHVISPGLHTESLVLYRFDLKSGKVQWKYRAQNSIRHNTIAIGGGRVFLIDRPPSKRDLERDFDKIAKKTIDPQHPLGELIALDSRTGNRLWSVKENIYGTLLAYSSKHDALLMTYTMDINQLYSEVGGKMTAFRGKDGKRLWEAQGAFKSRPIINDRTVYLLRGDLPRKGRWHPTCGHGDAWDLLTGKRKPFAFVRSFGCSTMVGSTHLLLFRSATLGYVDLSRGPETQNYSGFRPGCWLDVIPAGGLVLAPDYTERCYCSFENKAWLALYPKEKR